MRASLTIKHGLILLLGAFGLAACGGDMDDLDQYINEVKAKPGGRIEPLPEIKPYRGFEYSAATLSDPFSVDNFATAQNLAAVDGGFRAIEAE